MRYRGWWVALLVALVFFTGLPSRAQAPAAEEEHRDFVKRAGSVFNGRVVDEPRG